MKPFVILLAVAVGLFRPVLLFASFNPHVQSSYEAIAHGLVFSLYTAWMLSPQFKEGFCCWLCFAFELLFGWQNPGSPWTVRTASALSCVEIICATIKFFWG